MIHNPSPVRVRFMVHGPVSSPDPACALNARLPVSSSPSACIERKLRQAPRDRELRYRRIECINVSRLIDYDCGQARCGRSAYVE